MSVATAKPEKPYPDFPLTPHPNKQWCKKIRGKLHYFGPWDDWEAALNLYLDQKDDLHAGRKPRVNGDGMTLALALDHFLSAKKLLEQSGEISPRSYKDSRRLATESQRLWIPHGYFRTLTAPTWKNFGVTCPRESGLLLFPPRR